MSLVNEAVAEAFQADKMNCELLGNGESHLHWHLFPRKQHDTPIAGPVWWLDKEIMYADSTRPNQIELASLKDQLKQELNKSLAK